MVKAAFYIVTATFTSGDFLEILPIVNSLETCKAYFFKQIDSNASIITDNKIEQNVIIVVGSVVTTDIPDNILVYDSTSKIIKALTQINF